MPDLKPQFIPAGRTARFKQGDREIQVQTEFAPRPAPRITTTILSSGEIIKKQETPLESAITSQKELERVERALLRQHNEALRVFSGEDERGHVRTPFDTLRARLSFGSADHEKNNVSAAVKRESRQTQAPRDIGAASQRLPAVSPGTDKLSDSERVSATKRTTLERLYAIEGVDRIYTCDWRGNFVSEKSEREFKGAHGKIYKHRDELIEVFGELSNGKGRENGIYEVKARRLYLVSHCGFLYYLEFTRLPSGGRIEEVVRQALLS